MGSEAISGRARKWKEICEIRMDCSRAGGTLPAKSDEEDGGRTGNPEKGTQPKCKSREETREIQKEEKEKDKKFQQVPITFTRAQKREKEKITIILIIA